MCLISHKCLQFVRFYINTLKYVLIPVRYPTKSKGRRSKWIPSRRSRGKLQKRNGCNKCRKNKQCNKEVCVNDNGHAKSFANICEANKYLMKQPKSLQLVSFALGGCKDLYQRKYSNTFQLGPTSGWGPHQVLGSLPL